MLFAVMTVEYLQQALPDELRNKLYSTIE